MYNQIGIYDVCTNSEFRKQGFAKSLLNYVMNELYSNNNFYLTVSLKQPVTMQNTLLKFYGSFGFIEDKRDSDQIELSTRRQVSPISSSRSNWSSGSNWSSRSNWSMGFESDDEKYGSPLRFDTDNEEEIIDLD